MTQDQNPNNASNKEQRRSLLGPGEGGNGSGHDHYGGKFLVKMCLYQFYVSFGLNLGPQGGYMGKKMG